jgi:beta-glucosidase
MHIERRTTRLAVTTLSVGLALVFVQSSSAHAISRCPPPRVVSGAAPWLQSDRSPYCREEDVIAYLRSPERKLAALDAGFQSLGLPQFAVGDGPHGVAGGGESVTAFPGQITVAASFDTDIARRYGEALGEEFHNAGRAKVLGPAMDIARTWHAGRIAESYGEDPYLASEMAATMVAAIQSRHVVATIKHFAAYTQESGRFGDAPVGDKPAVNQIVGERVLREIYYPPFEAAVRRGAAGAVMCAFPRVNGIYTCENTAMLAALKHDWGFDGAVLPDFPNAQRSVIAAINAGLDEGRFFRGPPRPGLPDYLPGHDIDLPTAFKTGAVTEARLDEMIRRRLVPQFRIGTFEHPPQGSVETDVSTPLHQSLAREVTAAGAVLLKNDGQLLPLGGLSQSIAVIGAQAGEGAVVSEEGSAKVFARFAGNSYQSIVRRAGEAIVTYSPGGQPLVPAEVAPSSILRTQEGLAGLKAEYFLNRNRDFEGSPFASRVEPTIDVNGAPDIKGLPADNGWSVRWSGSFTSTKGGRVHLTLTGAGSARLLIDNRVAATFDRVDFSDTAYAFFDSAPHQPYPISVEWTPRDAAPMPRFPIFGGYIGTVLQLGWSEGPDLIAEAVDKARHADIAVIFASNRTGEGFDQETLNLPGDQNELIEAVAAVNPHTVVVLSTGGAVAMPWLAHVRAVLQLWYPGDAFASAASALLFGDMDPRGRLPITYPLDPQQGPVSQARQYPGSLAPDGSIDASYFDEGLAPGYRFYDLDHQTPLFPFGFGLSYARVKIDRINVTPISAGGLRLTAFAQNVSSREGAEVLQAYVGYPPHAGEPPLQLRGFTKTVLEPGESRRIRVDLTPAAFRLWDDKRHQWRIEPGVYRVAVGTSSRDIAYEKFIRVSSTGIIQTRVGNREDQSSPGASK